MVELANFLAGAAILVAPGNPEALAGAIADAATKPPGGAGSAQRLELARLLSRVDGLRAAATATFCSEACPGREGTAEELSCAAWLCPCARRCALGAAAE